jgi:hypothetical protein
MPTSRAHPKTLLDWARQVALQIHRWLPGRRIVIVGDTAFAAVEFLGAVRNYVSVVTRLRLDANPRCHRDSIKISRQLWDRAANALAYAA